MYSVVYVLAGAHLRSGDRAAPGGGMVVGRVGADKEAVATVVGNGLTRRTYTSQLKLIS